MEFLLVWFGLAIASAVIAPSRGRSAILWFFLAFFISGALAIILLLALPSKKVPQPAEVRLVEAPPSSNSKTCPKCAETIKRAARVCRFCGYSFEKELSIKSSPSQYLGVPYVVDENQSVNAWIYGNVKTWPSLEDFKAEVDHKTPPRLT
ncbi:zinc ribbon domain-containing protein [Xanthobacter sp. VTT E-85241]|uniref:zinc ribbon domain-containing protein n=1 Tax=Roseixanthobacter finlandensis TaxID=3119922 RepID=UPI00372BB798